MKNKISKIFLTWLPLGATIFLLCLFIVFAVQQNYRQSLNDPQIQMVEDGVNALHSGKVPADIVPRGDLIDIGSSLSPFIAVYDANGTPLESSGELLNAPPKPPIGVFQSAKQTGEDVVAWQPNDSTRIALVIKPVGNASGYFVVAGRNMRVVETRAMTLTESAILAVLGTWFVSFCLVALKFIFI